MSDVKVTPTEADREAAADIWRALNNRHVVDEILSGRGDDGATVQAFARHRLQGWSECKEAAAAIVVAAEASYREPTQWDYGALDACAKIDRGLDHLTPSTPES